MKKNMPNKKLNLNRQTIQKLDSNKLHSINAGAAAKPGTTTLIVSALASSEISTILCTIACIYTAS
ncbi:MAG TPA: class I lanthipeptide [Panacibacter sp.]|nr:class I lanthipeptide [Panacibacter sp.]